MNEEEQTEVRKTVETLLEQARLNVAMAENYEDSAKPFLFSARFLLKGVGIEKSIEELRAMLAHRKDVYTAEQYAEIVAEELLGKKEAADA